MHYVQPVSALADDGPRQEMPVIPQVLRLVLERIRAEARADAHREVIIAASVEDLPRFECRQGDETVRLPPLDVRPRLGLRADLLFAWCERPLFDDFSRWRGAQVGWHGSLGPNHEAHSTVLTSSPRKRLPNWSAWSISTINFA